MVAPFVEAHPFRRIRLDLFPCVHVDFPARHRRRHGVQLFHAAHKLGIVCLHLLILFAQPRAFASGFGVPAVISLLEFSVPVFQICPGCEALSLLNGVLYLVNEGIQQCLRSVFQVAAQFNAVEPAVVSAVLPALKRLERYVHVFHARIGGEQRRRVHQLAQRGVVGDVCCVCAQLHTAIVDLPSPLAVRAAEPAGLLPDRLSVHALHLVALRLVQRLKVCVPGVAPCVGKSLRRPSALRLVHRAQPHVLRLADRLHRRFRRAVEKFDRLIVVAARPLAVAVKPRVGVLHDLFPDVQLALCCRHADVSARQRLVAAFIDLVDPAPVPAALHFFHERAHVRFLRDEVPDLVLADLRSGSSSVRIHAQHHFAAVAVDDSANAHGSVFGVHLQKARHHRHALYAALARPGSELSQLVVPCFLRQRVQRLAFRTARHAQLLRARDRFKHCGLPPLLYYLSVFFSFCAFA